MYIVTALHACIATNLAGENIPLAVGESTYARECDVNYYRQHPDVYSVTSTGPLGVVTNPNGTVVLSNGGSTLELKQVGVTMLSLSAITAGLNTGVVVPFDVSERDDLGAFNPAYPGRIYIPSYVKEIRVDGRLQVLTAGTDDATYAGIVPYYVVQGNILNPIPKGGPGINVPNQILGTVQANALVTTPLLDVSGWSQLLPDFNYIELGIKHDDTLAAGCVVGNGTSFFSVEMHY